MELSKLYNISFNLNSFVSWLLLLTPVSQVKNKHRAVKSVVWYARKWQSQALNAFKQQLLICPNLHFCSH